MTLDLLCEASTAEPNESPCNYFAIKILFATWHKWFEARLKFEHMFILGWNRANSANWIATKLYRMLCRKATSAIRKEPSIKSQRLRWKLKTLKSKTWIVHKKQVTLKSETEAVADSINKFCLLRFRSNWITWETGHETWDCARCWFD